MTFSITQTKFIFMKINVDLQFKELHKTLAALREEVKNLRQMLKDSVNKIYTEKQLQELLGVGDKTLRSYRANGLISYSQIGNKFFYRQSDIDNLLTKARVEAD